MKSVGPRLIFLALLVMLTSCGKDNKSGKSGANAYPFGNPYYANGLNGAPNIGNINSPYSYGGMSLNQVMAENPCISGYGGYAGATGAYGGQRIPIQVPLTNFPSVITPGDVYVGVTSYGDVGALVGTSVGQPPMFVGYLCPRSFSPNGTGQLLDVRIGAYTNCLFKPITAANVVFPGGASANFRMLDYGSSTGGHFTFCR